MTITQNPQGNFYEDSDFLLPVLLRFGWHTCPCAHMQIDIRSFSWDLYVNVMGRFPFAYILEDWAEFMNCSLIPESGSQLSRAFLMGRF